MKNTNQAALFFQGFLAGFKKFGFIVAEIINGVLLSIAYFIGVGIVSLFFKLKRKHLLDLGKKKKESYWIDNKVEMKSEDQYYRQY